MVLGATNRPNDIDSAILRRMPKRFAVGLPNFDQRLKILALVSLDVLIDCIGTKATCRFSKTLS